MLEILQSNFKWIIISFVSIVVTIILFRSRDKRRFLFLFLIFCIPLQAGVSWWRVGGSGKIIMLLDLPLFLLIVIGLTRGRLFRRVKPISRIYLPAVLIIVWAALSSLVNAEWIIPSAVETFIMIKALILSLYAANHIRSKKDISEAVTILLLSLFFVSMIGIAQYIFDSSLGLAFLGSWGLRHETVGSRTTGTLQFPNVFASYLIILLPLALSFFLLQRESINKIFYGSLLFAGLLALITTFSRSGWLGLLVSAMVFVSLLFYNGRVSHKVMSAIAVLILVGIISLFTFWGKIVSRLDTNVLEAEKHRIGMLKSAMKVIMVHPILGAGLWNYQEISTQLLIAGENVEGGNVHNTYLLIAGELGIPGLFFFLWFIYAVLKQGLAVAKLKDGFLSITAIGIISGLSAILVQLLATPTYRFASIRAIFWLLAGILVAERQVQLNLRKKYFSSKMKRDLRTKQRQEIIKEAVG